MGTLDWEFPELKVLNIDVRVHGGGQLLYVATTWAGYIGMLTVQRPGRYAAAVNFRERHGASANGDGLSGQPLLPVGLAVRLALERCSTYADFVQDVATVPVMAPFYCMVASATWEGAQITRDKTGELSRRQLGNDVTHLIQANMDHWDDDESRDTQESLVRCRVATKTLQAAMARGSATEAELWGLLWKHPIYETGYTLYCTVMHPSSGTYRSMSDPPEGVGSGEQQQQKQKQKQQDGKVRKGRKSERS